MSSFVESQKLTNPASDAAGLFGVSVALAGDGNTALVGASGDSENIGSATVFIRAGTTWFNQQTLWFNQQTLLGLTGGTDKEIGPGTFGSSVALSSDGNTALVGASGDREGIGSATVFIRAGTTWINQQTLLGLTSGTDKEIGPGNFGSSVALSSDGNTALVGAPNDREGIGSVGARHSGTAPAFCQAREHNPNRYRPIQRGFLGAPSRTLIASRTHTAGRRYGCSRCDRP
jgi:hypothetical protein